MKKRGGNNVKFNGDGVKLVMGDSVLYVCLVKCGVWLSFRCLAASWSRQSWSIQPGCCRALHDVILLQCLTCRLREPQHSFCVNIDLVNDLKLFKHTPSLLIVLFLQCSWHITMCGASCRSKHNVAYLLRGFSTPSNCPNQWLTVNLMMVCNMKGVVLALNW